MEHSFRISCKKDNLREVRDFVNHALAEYPISDSDRNMLTLAVDEVCANLIIHTHKCNPDDFIDLSIRYANGSLLFEIMDRGASFNMLEYEEHSLKEIVKAKRKGGLGIMLVKKIMDQIEISNSASQNICRLYKKIAV